VARRSEPSIEEDTCQRSRDLANSEVRKVKAQTFGIPSREDTRSEKVNNRWIWIEDSRWIRTWDRASESRKKIPKELAARIASLRGHEISTVGGQVATTKRRSGIQVAEALGISLREVPRYWH
jgi:hypothetical protein